MLTGSETKKAIVSAGDAVMRPQAPVNVVDGNGGAVIVGRAEAGVDDTAADPTGRRGHACRGTIRRTDRCRDCRRLSQHHRGLLI